MPDRPYTDDDLRAEAARQHSVLTEDPDYVGVGEQMADTEIESHLPPAEADGAEGWHWDEALDEDQFDEAQRKIHGLIVGAADLSEWAVNLGADGLEPYDGQLTLDGGSKPIARIHFAFAPDMPEDMRIALVQGVGGAIARYL
ncbi:hypothetical protein GTY86_35705 [Streptomyces sp. SID5770]|uniref:hypothetical protein n=1 Tax=Streptomyces sp. SID5770 TaxID=2690308 RepID=UPI00136BD5A6|nr:hypothetical protein [Streptomyces sp. SID5770]MZE53789.1 hypothetical protein [Streptomyces sp. SID5770]MZE56522.1 hypothetical protein [Streptomyces sp. SID5770]